MIPLAECTLDKIDELCLVKVGHLLCGIDLRHVLEISLSAHVTPAYGAPSYVRGVANLRGHIVTILDLRCRLGLPSFEADSPCQILIVEGEGEKIGLLVDEVKSIIPMDMTHLHRKVGTLKGLPPSFCLGVYRTQGDLVALLNLKEMIGGQGS